MKLAQKTKMTNSNQSSEGRLAATTTALAGVGKTLAELETKKALYIGFIEELISRQGKYNDQVRGLITKIKEASGTELEQLANQLLALLGTK